jgi:hypothetical protein
LIVRRAGFIDMVIIPLFDRITWHTKKYLDYCDWKAIFNLRKMGLHYLPEGKALIECIVKQIRWTIIVYPQTPTTLKWTEPYFWIMLLNY